MGRYSNPQTTKVVSVTGTNSALIGAFSSESGRGQVTVIDFISYTALSGGAAETWVLQVTDNASGIIWAAKESVAATTADTIHIVFTHGLPCWNMTNSATDTGIPPGTTTVALTGQTGADATSQLTVGYHYAVRSELME